MPAFTTTILFIGCEIGLIALFSIVLLPDPAADKNGFDLP
ncbi:MAG: hypothetical protein JWQ07_5917 [Ramlibacter sp.]|jgi:hypothetical protein|nr:hypothetical protein [Ramlibacter sp.]